MPLRVGLSVDAISPELTGIGRYCWELARGLPAHPSVSELIAFRGSERVGDVRDLTRNDAPRRRKRSRLTRWLTRKPAIPPADIVHGPNYTLPDWAEAGVVTFHDLSVFRFPEFHPAERVASFEREIEKTLAKSLHLLTDCETIREEVIDFTGFAADRVTAVPLGISPEFRPVSPAERTPVLQRLGIPTTGYGLTLSSMEPRKRIEHLLHAWRELPSNVRQRYPLVIAGAQGWHNDRLHSEIAKAAAEGWAIVLGFVPEVDLPALYSGAAAFVYPSVYEGFGLPPLEAMATGVPVVVASGSCLREVTKGAAMLAEPDDVTGFSRTIQQALEDETWRKEAISAGIQVAAGYTWAKCIDKTVGVYQRVTGCYGV